MTARNRKARLSLPVLLVLLFVPVLIGAGYLWFLANFEKKEVEIPGRISQAARANPYLAAEKYLAALGYGAESLRGLDLLATPPSAEDAIFLARLPAGLPERVVDSLFAWVTSGGHLILMPNTLKNDNPNYTDFCQRLGVRFSDDNDSDCGCDESGDENSATEDADLQPTASSEENDEESDEGNDEEKDDNGYHPFREIHAVTVGDHSIRLEGNGYGTLVDVAGTAVFRIPASFTKEYTEEKDKKRSDHGSLIDQENNWLLQYRVGSGTVTVLSETRFLTNIGIGDEDHAFFLSYLAGSAHKIWIISTISVDSLVEIVWKKFPLFWVALLFCLAVTVWVHQMRTGPLHKPEKGEPNSILTHIGATGNYFWRRDKCRTILRTNRHHFLQIWLARSQGKRSASLTDQADLSRLSKNTGLTEEELQEALQHNCTTEHEFIRTSRALHKLSLAFGGRERKRS